MFRCITKVKGLVFDIDSFEDEDTKVIAKLFSGYNLLFMTSSERLALKIGGAFGDDLVYKTEGFQRVLAPNISTHKEVLERLAVQSTELVYVSKKIGFLVNAMNFLGGTAWIADDISYEDASNAPDLICESLEDFANCLDEDVEGFLGEIVVSRNPLQCTGMIITAEFESDKGSVPMYMLGRYYGASQYMSQLHPYSAALLINKNPNSASYGTYDEVFGKLISAAVGRVVDEFRIDGICAVPSRPEKKNRFGKMLDSVSQEYGIDNYEPLLVCNSDYPRQKSLSYQERQENVKGVFSFNRRLHGESIIIVDDIISTGATMNECINCLYSAGAGEICIIVLAVNQPSTNYWSSNEIHVSCPKCGGKMRLLINSRDRSFFYSCYDRECGMTMNYLRGRAALEDLVNG